ncbi:hypothetical protein D3C84_745380 [compost metagenome]
MPEHMLGMAHQVAQWRTHLMSEIFRETGELGKSVFKSRQHLIEGFAENSEFAQFIEVIQPQM